MTLRLTPDYPLAKYTWLGTGGNADYFGVADTFGDLKEFLKTNTYPIHVLGAGSNVLIRDGGIEGVVLKLGKDFQKIKVKDNTLICGAGARLSEIAKVALENELSGFEFMADIPGTLGGGLFSNAGAFGRALSDCLVQVGALTFDGLEKKYTDFSDWGYRHNPIRNVVFTRAVLKAEKSLKKEQIQSVMDDYRQQRKARQPQGVRTAGSTFKNPKGKSAGFLLEKCGLKGYKENGAEMSLVHANFLINRGASGNQLEDFVLQAQKKVLQNEGVLLQMEIQCLGRR